MSAPTVTRAVLRRELARRLRMPFSVTIGDSSTLTGTPTTTVLADTTKLTHKDDYWNKSFMFLVNGTAAGDVREVADFYDSGSRLMIDVPLSGTPGSGNTYELHTRWSAADLHSAINHAIDAGFPDFFSVTVDESVPVQRDTLAYSLPGNPYFVSRMWLGQNSTKARGTATSGAATTLTDSAAAWTVNDFANQKVSIIYGTGKGQIRTISSNTATALTVSSAWTTNPSSDSQYVIWEAVKQEYEWYRLHAVRFDRPKWPTTFYFPQRYSEWEGQPIRIEYVGAPAALTAEADTTIVPAEYVYHKAQAYLYGLRLAEGAKVDADRYRYLQTQFEILAEKYRQSERWQMPPGTVWQEADLTRARQMPRDYPFA